MGAALVGEELEDSGVHPEEEEKAVDYDKEALKIFEQLGLPDPAE